MKLQFLFVAALIATLTSCGGENEEPDNSSKQKGPEAKEEVASCRHIISESTKDYPMTLRSDKDMIIYDRMILEIEINADGSFTIEGEKADWDDLEEEVNRFFKMNRDLGNARTSSYLNDKNYRGANYPFFNYFDRKSYQSYIDRLREMAETDMKAGLYAQRHIRRIKAFDAVSDEELAFINLGALIRYVHPDDLPQDKIDEFEQHLADYICAMRNELAQEKFGKSYHIIRLNARKDDESQKQILYLQEMYPAYLLRLKESELEEPEMPAIPEPVPPKPEPIEVIEDTEDERDAIPR